MSILVVAAEQQGKLICESLEMSGFDCVLRTDSKSAVAALYTVNIDAIVLCPMRGCDTWHIASFAKSAGNAPIILVDDGILPDTARMSAVLHHTSSVMGVDEIGVVAIVVQETLLASAAEPITLNALLIDDYSDTLSLFKHLLAPVMHMTQACSITAALNLYTPGKYDVVLSDIRLGRESGLDLIREIKTLSPSQLCVGMSAVLDAEMARTLGAMGAYALEKDTALTQRLQWEIHSILMQHYLAQRCTACTD